jgi:PIN domain nuclease of toxin-antitoxin system
MGGQSLKYLLDTPALVWALDDPSQLPPRVRRLLGESPSHPLGLAAISLWEIATKASSGKLQLAKPIGDWIAAAVRPPFVAVIGLDERVAIESCQLPGNFHRDPADRMIVATARIFGLTLLTKDQAIRDYSQVKTFWESRPPASALLDGSWAAGTRAGGATMPDVAMFDEIDEGTEIMKTSQNPPVGESPFLHEEGLPSDYCLRVTGEIRQRLRAGSLGL